MSTKPGFYNSRHFSNTEAQSGPFLSREDAIKDAVQSRKLSSFHTHEVCPNGYIGNCQSHTIAFDKRARKFLVDAYYWSDTGEWSVALGPWATREEAERDANTVMKNGQGFMTAKMIPVQIQTHKAGPF